MSALVVRVPGLSWSCSSKYPSHHMSCLGTRIQNHRRVPCECDHHRHTPMPPQRVRTHVLTDKGRQAIAGLPRDEIPSLGVGTRPARAIVLTDKGRAAIGRAS